MSEKFIPLEIDAEKATKMFLHDFAQHLEVDDALTSIIKAHLYIEALLLMLLEHALLEPDRLSLDRMPFEAKVRLCVAAGLLHVEVEPALQKLGRIRNDFAHTLWPQFDTKKESDFLNVVHQSGRLRSHFTKPEPIWDGYRGAIWAIWVYLFEQVCRAAQGRKILANFWAKMTDVSEVPSPSRGLPMRPSSLEEARALYGKGKKNGRSEEKENQTT